MRALRRPRRRTPLSTTPIGVNHRLEQAALYSPVQQRAAIASRRYRCERRVHRGAHAVHAFAGCALFGASTTALYSIDLLTGADILIGRGAVQRSRHREPLAGAGAGNLGAVAAGCRRVVSDAHDLRSQSP
jgi:hypothetical protein